MNETQTLEPVEETVLQPESDLIPLALIAVEVGESVDRIAHRFAGEVVLDDIGMRAVTATAAREFFTERAEQRARHEEERARRAAQRAPKPAPAGVPAPEGADSGIEALMASGDYVLPSEEFGRPAPNFLEEELAAGRQAAAEKEALVKKMKDDLS